MVSYGTKLCPFGVQGGEPLDVVDGWVMGLREAVWRGHVTLDRGIEICPDLDWSVIKHEAE